MGDDTVSDKGPITRSSKEALSKRTIASASASSSAATTPSRRSERLEKQRTPPSLAVRMDQKKKKTATATMTTPSPLRRSERTRNASPSSSSPPLDPSASKSSKTRLKKQLVYEDEDEEGEVEYSSKRRGISGCVYRGFFGKSKRDCHGKTNGVDRSTQEGDEEGRGKIDGDKIDDCVEGNCLDSAKDDKDTLPPEDATGTEMRAEPELSGPVKELLDNNNVTVNSLVSTNATTDESSGASARVQSDSSKEETSQMLGSRDSISNENLITKCFEHGKGEDSVSAKRKRTMQDMHSDGSAMSVDNYNSNLIEDAHPSRICSNVVETSELCSKRIRRISLSTNNVDQTSSKSSGEKLSSRNKEGNSGGPLDSERPQGNTLETEKIRKQQRNLHLLLKPEITNLCEILRLPDNVKTMVENCLEYTMNNYQICTEPASILQAFQLSLCWTAASLLNHKLDFEASLVLAKQHLNFDCKKELVDEINSRLWALKENFLLLTANSNVAGYPKVSESSNGVYSYKEVTPEFELVKNDNSKNIENVQRRKGQWNRLVLMQLEEKQKLRQDMETETAEFLKRYRIEWAAMRSSSPNDVMTNEKLRVFNSEYVKRIKELERQHEIRRKALEAKQLKIRLTFQESSAPDDLLNPVASNELGTKVESLQIQNQAQNHNAPKPLVSDHVAEGNGFNDIVEVMTRTCTGVGSSEASDANASVVVPCSGPVELQIPLVKHVDAIEMGIAASKDGPVSGNKCNNIAENEYDNQGNIIYKHSKSREQCSDGAISMPDKGEGCVNFSCESHNDFGQNAITQVLPSSDEEICDGETLVVPSGEVAPTICNNSSSNGDCVEIPSSRQGELNGTILSKPVYDLSIVEANGSNDGAKNMAPLNSQSSEEHIPSVNTIYTPNCENDAQIDEADDNYGSSNAETVNSPLSDERSSPWNSKSPQDHVHNENVTCMLNCGSFACVHEDDDDNGSNNVILNQPLIDERNADGTMVLNRDTDVGMLETVNSTPSTGQISGGAVDVSVLDSVLSSCRADSPISSSDANAIILSNQPSLEIQNPDGVSSSIPAEQIPVEVLATSHEMATVNVLDGEEAMGMTGTVNCTDYPENVSMNSPSMDQRSNGGPVLDRDLSSRPCTTSPSNGWTLPGEEIPVVVPENSHEEAECQLTDSVVVDKSATSDQLEGVCRTMTENNLSQETQVSRPDDLMEPLEQVQTLSSAESPPDRDTAREMQNTLVSSPVDIVPANQSIHDSPVVEAPEQEGQLPSAGFLSSNPDLCNLPLVAGTEDRPSNECDLPIHICETSAEIQNEAVVQHASNSDQQEEVCITMTENSFLQETPVSRSADLMEPLEQVQPLSSVESPPDRDTVRDMQNNLVSSPVDTVRDMQNNLVSSPVDIVPANRSINDSLFMEPTEQERQLPSAGFHSSNQDPPNRPLVTGTEDQSSNEDDLPNHNPETSIQIQNQAVLQLASNLELDSCSRQVVHPSSNMDLDLPLSGGVRLQSSDSRNLSTFTGINNDSIQSASQSASMIFPLPGLDPLRNESERLRRLSEQNMKDYENKKLLLKCDFEKELQELCRKFAIKRKGMEAELQKIMKDLDTQFNIVLKNRILAEAFRAKSMDLKVSGAPGMQQDASFTQHLYQLASQENATRPSLVPGPSSCQPPAPSLLPSPVPGPSSCGLPAPSLRPSPVPGPSSCGLPAPSLQPSPVPGPSSCGLPAPSLRPSLVPGPSSRGLPAPSLQASLVPGPSSRRLPAPSLQPSLVPGPSSRRLPAPSLRTSPVPGPSSCGLPAPSLRTSPVPGPSSCGLPPPSLRPSPVPGPSSCRLPAPSLRPSPVPSPSSCGPPAPSLPPSPIPGPSSCGPPAPSLPPSPIPGPSSCGPPAPSLPPSPIPGPSSCGPPAPSLPPSPIPGPSSCGPPAPSLQSSYTTTASQTKVPPIQATHNTSGTFSSVSARLPHISSLSSPLGNVQTAGEIRAPAPHLQPYKPPTSITASSLCTVPLPHVRPSQPAPSNIPVTSPFPHQTPRPMQATFQSVPHRGLRSGSTGGLPTSNLSSMNSRADAIKKPAMNLPNVLPRFSDLASLNVSKFCTSSSAPANPAHKGTSGDVVCLSDDDE